MTSNVSSTCIQLELNIAKSRDNLTFGDCKEIPMECIFIVD